MSWFQLLSRTEQVPKSVLAFRDGWMEHQWLHRSLRNELRNNCDLLEFPAHSLWVFPAQLQARSSSFRDQERRASCGFASASIPLAKSNTGSATRGISEESEENGAGAVVWAGNEILPAESHHRGRNNKLQPPWSYPACYGEVGLGWMRLQNVPFLLESLAVWWNILISSPFSVLWVHLAVRGQILDFWKVTAFRICLGDDFNLTPGSASGFNSWCITAQIWPILSQILDLWAEYFLFCRQIKKGICCWHDTGHGQL